MAAKRGALPDAGVVERMGVRWTKIAKTVRVIPWPGSGESSTGNVGEAKAYNCRIFEMNKVSVPKFILDKGMGTGGAQKVQVHLTATMFDTQKKTFFGSTWTGKRLDMAQCCKASTDKVKWNGQEAGSACSITFGPDYGFSFCTAANMENVRLAVELVMTEVDSTGTIRGQEYSVCWSAMPMNAQRDIEKFVYARAAEGEVSSLTPIFSGTPRVLMYVGADPKLLAKAKIEKAEAKHITMTHFKLTDAAKILMVQDELVDGEDLTCVPGLNDQARIMDAIGAKVAASCPLALEDLHVDCGDDFGTRLEAYIKASSGQSFSFKELCAEIGVHNGRRYLGSPQLHHFPMAQLSASKWSVKGEIKLADYIANNAVAVVILVHAVGTMGGDGNSRVCIGWLPLVPVEVAGVNGPIVTGAYEAYLIQQAPMTCVSHALVYADGQKRPRLRVKLRNRGTGHAETSMTKKVEEAKALKEAAKAAALEADEYFEEEETVSERTKVPSHRGAASSKASASMAPTDDDADMRSLTSAGAGSRAPVLEPAEPAKAPPSHKAVLNSKGELFEFTLACNSAALGGSRGIVEVDALEMDMSLADINKELEEEFGHKVNFRYTPFDKNGSALSPIQVDSEAKLETLKDVLEDDLEGVKMYNGRIEVEVYPAGAPAPAIVTPAPLAKVVSTPAATPAVANPTPAAAAASGLAAASAPASSSTMPPQAASTPAAAPNNATPNNATPDARGASGAASHTPAAAAASATPAATAVGGTTTSAATSAPPHTSTSAAAAAAATTPATMTPAAAAAAASAAAAAAGTAAAGTGGGGSGPAAPVRKALSEVALLCSSRKVDGRRQVERVGEMPVGWTWGQVRKELKKVFGQDVLVEYQDDKERDVVVNSDEAWRVLVQDLQDDWQRDRDLNGEMECELLPDPAAQAGLPAASVHLASVLPAPPSGGRSSRLSRGGSARSSGEGVPAIKGLRRAADENDTPQTRVEEGGGPRMGRRSSAAGMGRGGPGGAGLTARSTDGSEVDSARGGGGQWGAGSAAPRSHPQHWAVDEDIEYAEADEGVRRSVSRHMAGGSTSISRALKAKLFTTSVIGVVDNYHKEVPFVETGAGHGDLSRDASDVHRAHEIVIQVVAVKLAAAHKSLFFTMSFYQFGVTQTKTGRVQRSTGEGEGDAAMIEGDAGASGVSLTFTVDPFLDSNSFARYLSARTLQVEVWDADSLLPLGSFHLDLRPLLRGGREAVQTAGEYPIIDASSLSSSATSGDVRGSLVGLPTSLPDIPSDASAFVRMVNIGRLSTRSHRASSSDGDPHYASTHGPSRILPLIDEPAMQPQGSPSKGLVMDLSPARGMAILYANRASISAALMQRGFVQGAAVPGSALQEACVACRLDMTARQLAWLISHMSDETGGTIDVGLLYMPGEEAIAGMQEDDKTKARMRELAGGLAGAVAERFGGPVRAFGKYTVGGEPMGGGQFAELLRDVGISMTDAERGMMLRVMGGGARGEFEAFLSVGLRGTAVKGGAGAGDSERKMARWRRVRASRRQGWGEPAEEEKQLLVDAARMMRETHKAHKIKAFLESCITTKQVVRASFGETCYFQYLLRNPYSEDRVILINFIDPELHVVTDANEWRALNAAWGYGGSVEEDMFGKEAGGGLSVWLQGHQEILVPFKFITYASGKVSVATDGVSGSISPVVTADASSEHEATRARTIEVTFSPRKPNGTGEAMYLLNVQVEPDPLVVDHSFRFYHGQNDFLKKRILVDSAASGPGGGWREPPGRAAGASVVVGTRQAKYAWCTDSSVIVASSGLSGQPGMDEVTLKCRVGAAGTLRSFYVVVYENEHCTSVFEVWRVTVHAVHRMDIQGLVGQTEREGCSLTLRTQGEPKKVIAMSSHPKELAVDKEGGLQIGSALTEVPIRYTPMAPGRKDILVHFIEEGGPKAASPISAWLIVARAKMPVVNKRYDIRIAAGKPSSKKIMYTNPYSINRTFKLGTDRPSLLTFRDSKAELEVAAKASQYISLRFAACPRACTQEILLFVNDEDDKNEECLCISVTYYA